MVQYLDIAMFSSAIFLAFAGLVGLSGFFPAEARPASLHNVVGNLLLGILGCSVLSLAAAALWIGLYQLTWPVAVIAGGFAVLLAPLGIQAVPRPFIDSRWGVITMTLITTSSAILVLAGLHFI